MTRLPSEFLERLSAILPEGHYQSALKGFAADRPLTVRINTLKVSEARLLDTLQERQVAFEPTGWSPQAMWLPDMASAEFRDTDLVKNGWLYSQGLSSMIPPLVLDPRPGERVLDMCAAPGSKATQIAALMQNQGEVVCVDAIRKRFFKLKSVVSLMGAKIACTCMDARRYRSPQPFDRILVDVPCSAEGRFRTFDKKSFAYWSRRKIKEMVRKQRGLLLHAGRLLKVGGVMVYATCTFAPEENEGVVDWVLRKAGGTLQTVPVKLAGVPTYPALESWQDKPFDGQVKHCLRILPTPTMEGFFVAKLKRVA